MKKLLLILFLTGFAHADICSDLEARIDQELQDGDIVCCMDLAMAYGNFGC